MIKYYCDYCEKETPVNLMCAFDYLCHLDGEVGHATAIGGAMKPISRRIITKELCILCYNNIVGEAVNKLNHSKQTRYE